MCCRPSPEADRRVAPARVHVGGSHQPGSTSAGQPVPGPHPQASPSRVHIRDPVWPGATCTTQPGPSPHPQARPARVDVRCSTAAGQPRPARLVGAVAGIRPGGRHRDAGRAHATRAVVLRRRMRPHGRGRPSPMAGAASQTRESGHQSRTRPYERERLAFWSQARPRERERLDSGRGHGPRERERLDSGRGEPSREWEPAAGEPSPRRRGSSHRQLPRECSLPGKSWSIFYRFESSSWLLARSRPIPRAGVHFRPRPWPILVDLPPFQVVNPPRSQLNGAPARGIDRKRSGGPGTRLFGWCIHHDCG